MDIRIVAYLTAQMVVCLGGVYVIPWGMSMYFQDGCSDVFFTCVFICNLIGYLLRHYGRFNKFTQSISNRDIFLDFVRCPGRHALLDDRGTGSVFFFF